MKHQAGTRLLLSPKSLIPLSKSAYSRFDAHNGTRMAAALAYYTIFSLAPLLVIAISIAGLVFGKEAAQNAISKQIEGLTGPESARFIQTIILSAHKPLQGMIATIIGFGTLLAGASGVFTEIEDALTTILGAEPRVRSGIWKFFKSRLLGVGMVLAIGFLLLVSLLLSAFVAGAFKYFGGVISLPEILFHAVEAIVSLFVITTLFAMMFKVLPETKLGWHDVWFGAFTTALLFTAGKVAIGFYVGKTISASSYGAAGSVLLLIAWVYYSALILYFGAELTNAYATQFGSRAGAADASSPEKKAA